MTKPSEYFPTTVDEYLATVPNDVHKVFQKLRYTIKSIVPEAEERKSLYFSCLALTMTIG
jgi:uncharacterized protein YdhG (YjbR/CyaY superfamily)